MAQDDDAPAQVRPAGRLHITSLMVQAMAAAAKRAMTAPFAGQTGAPALSKDVRYAIMRTIISSSTISVDRALSETKSTEAAYHQHVLTRTPPSTINTITLPSSTKAHWLGSPQSDTVIVYFHGGGYVLPATHGHFAFLDSLRTDLERSPGTGRSVGVVVLSYGLAPENVYPAQLSQAAELVSELINKGRPADSIILAGDSAGGSLALSLVSHVLHPHPDPTITRIDLGSSGRFKGVLLLSPWASLLRQLKPDTADQTSDFLTPSGLERWGGAFLGQYDFRNDSVQPVTTPPDQYADPASASASWWTGLSSVVSDLLIWAGGGELMADSIVDLYWRLKEGYVSGGGHANEVRLVVEPRRAHVEMIFDWIAGYASTHSAVTPNRDLAKEWVRSRL